MSRTVVVTGAASGIGRATAALLTSRGDRVIGVDLRETDVCADLSTPAGRSDAVAGVLSLAPTVDAVVACAGISGNSPGVVAINFFGVTEFVTGMLPALAGSSAPRVAVVASSVAIHASDAALGEACLAGDEEAAQKRAVELEAEGHGRAIYPGSKGALARWVRRESITDAWAGAGVALNAVGPGVVLTPMSAGLFDDPRMVAAMDGAVPMVLNGHQGPEVIASTLAFLVSEENSHITGQVIFCDGGAETVHRGSTVF
ncbi:SDR family oxidoreductase [Nocardioides jensenii]|uniref:SDR family oxidoreductase n=1 Tax=Nocardioides jensenii TaxID=1843 RepID=UPI00082B7768|nr:SDR family oxidoreductase [Nocardioides jensenii]